MRKKLKEPPTIEANPHTTLQLLLEEIKEPECAFSHTFLVRRNEDVPIFATEREDGVAIFDVPRSVYFERNRAKHTQINDPDFANDPLEKSLASD